MQASRWTDCRRWCGQWQTVAALMTMLMAIDNSYQASLMAPTGNTATQHFETISTMVEGLGVKGGVFIRIGQRQERQDTLNLLAEGLLIFWLAPMHSSKTTGIPKHGLVYHRWAAPVWCGTTRQPMAKERSGSSAYLVMTATLIPRTLALSMYGDLACIGHWWACR